MVLQKKFILTALQKGMLSYHLLWPHSGVDIEQMIINLPEEVDINHLQQAWATVFQNNDILRASFQWSKVPEPFHIISQEIKIPFIFEDWSEHSPQEIIQKQKRFLSRDREQGFHLSMPPLSRLLLVKLEEKKYRLFWTFHHILIDGRSFIYILLDVFNCYKALVKKISFESTERAPFETYIDWLSKENKEKKDGAEVFWKKRLKGFTYQTPLPFESIKNNTLKESRYGEVNIFLSEEFSSSLKKYAQQENITLNTLLLAAWALLLSRHSQSNDVIFGVTKTTRSSSIEKAKEMIGLFLTTLPVRVFIDENALVKDWLKTIRQDWISMRPFEHVSFKDLRSWSELSGSKGLFDSLVLFENTQFEEELKSLDQEWAKREVQLLESTNFSLSLLGYGGKQIRLKLEYDNHQFSEVFAKNLLAQVQNIFRGIFVSSEKTIQAIDILSNYEKNLLFTQWNKTDSPFNDKITIPDMVAKHAQKTPEKIAVQFDNQKITYKELDHQSTHLATHLIQKGIGSGVLVGIGIERSLEMVLCLLAVLKSGAAYVPLDPAFPKNRLILIIKDSGLAFILTSESTSPLFDNLDVQKIIVEKCLNQPIFNTDYPKEKLPNSLAYILYTSGSTGRPKGVKIPQIALLNFLNSMSAKPGINSSDVLLAVTTLSFDISALEIFLPLINGAQLVVANRETTIDGRLLLKKIETIRPSLIQATPATFRMLLDTGFSKIPELTVLCGGEAFPPDLAKALWKRSRNLWNMYGPTETTIWSTIEKITFSTEKITIGRPIDNTQIFILDSNLRPVPLGAIGELCIGGKGLAIGYHNLPDLTSEKFVNVSFKNCKRIYRTGDLARYLPDGKIECLGRTDHQIKIRGFRIELGDIEGSLIEHENINHAAVILREDSSGKMLIAYIVVEDEGIETSVYKEYLLSKLPTYMVPSIFIKLDALPLTPNKKIDRKALPPPNANDWDESSLFVHPTNNDEFQMKKIWEKILKNGNISMNDNFFDIKGDSLLAVSLLVEIEKKWGYHLPISIFVEAPTIKKLVLKLQGSKKTYSSLVKIDEGKDLTIFMIPGAAGHSMAFRDYISHIKGDYSIYAIEISEYDVNNSVQELARLSLQEIQKKQPHGPYVLIGLCFGAFVSFEIACELEKQGEKVIALELLDPPPLDIKLSFNILSNMAIKHLNKFFLRNPFSALYSFYKLLSSKINKPNQKEPTHSDFMSDSEKKIDKIIEKWDQERDLRIKKGKKYLPSSYHGSVDIFNIKENGIYISTLIEKSWDQVTKGPTKKYFYEGHHGNFFLNPHVEKIVQVLEQRLQLEERENKL